MNQKKDDLKVQGNKQASSTAQAEEIKSALNALATLKSMGIAPQTSFESVSTPGLNPWGDGHSSLPWQPGVAEPWGGLFPSYYRGGYRDQAENDKIIEAQRREAESKQREVFEAIQRQCAAHSLARSNALEREKIEKDARATQAIRWAEGIESAQGPLGARHFLRQALSAGHDFGLRRCWAAVVEQGWEIEALKMGKSETLLAAALGLGSVAALAFLVEIGFEPGPKLATHALRAAMAGGASGAALESLCRDFGAGALNELVIAELERRVKGLGALARARGEAYEINALTCQKVSIESVRPRRL